MAYSVALVQASGEILAVCLVWKKLIYVDFLVEDYLNMPGIPYAWNYGLLKVFTFGYFWVNTEVNLTPWSWSYLVTLANVWPQEEHSLDLTST